MIRVYHKNVWRKKIFVEALCVHFERKDFQTIAQVNSNTVHHFLLNTITSSELHGYGNGITCKLVTDINYLRRSNVSHVF